MIFKNINSGVSSISKLNDHLKRNYKVTVSETSTPEELQALKENSLARMQYIKYRESANRFKNNEYLKHSLIVEAVDTLLAVGKKNTVSSKTKYSQVVDALCEYVVEAFAEGVPLKEALDNTITLAKKAHVKYPVYDLYARVRSKLKEDLEDEFLRKKKDPVSANVWNLIHPEKRRSAADAMRQMKSSSSEDWKLLDMDDADPVKGFIDPSAMRRNDPNVVPAHQAQKAASMIKPNSVLQKARLEMKESTVRKVRMLVENEVEQAEVISAARDFGRQLQNMVEKIGRLQNENLGPVIDQMRLAFGNDTATSFNDIVNGQLQSILDQLKTAREEIDVVVTDVAIKNQISVGNDMDDLGGGAGMDDMGMEPDIVAGADDEFGTVDDDFGGDVAAAGEEDDPLGRVKKESIRNLKKKIMETQKRLHDLKKSRR